MNYAQQLRHPGGHRAGLAIVVLLHLLLGWALLHALARTAITVIPPPIDVAIPDVKSPPPPPPLPDLPQPKRVLPQWPVMPLPDFPRDADPTPTLTVNREVATPESSPLGGAMPMPTPPTPATPRPVAKPAIANVQACAPTSEDYPAAARRAEAAGVTRLRFTIDAAGRLMRSEVVRSAGSSREHRLLDKVAEGKLAGCSFAAGVDENGHPTGGTFEVDYVWKLE